MKLTKTISVFNLDGIHMVEISGIKSAEYGQTTAAGTVEFALKHKVLPCGSGDDYQLLYGDIKEITEKVDSLNKDLFAI